jgi:hypothetical protein
MVEKIITVLDTSQDGILSLAEVKVLFSKLLCKPVEEIPDTHREVATGQHPLVP